MAKRNVGKLNYLERLLPEGLLVDAAWLGNRGYSTSLRSQYVSAGRVWVYPELSVCLNCGNAQFVVSNSQLSELVNEESTGTE